MHIVVLFRFNQEKTPVAITGITGDVADILLPAVGDLVRHTDVNGDAFEGKVTERIFKYELSSKVAADGGISVTLCLDRTVVH